MKKIAIVGTSLNDTAFLVGAVLKIIELSGNNAEVEVVSPDVTVDPTTINADLIFTQMNEPKGNEPTELYKGLCKWMAQQKHAYCMVSEHHPMGLHNYNNFRNIIVPMNMVFKPLRFEVDKEGKVVSPATLIDALRPAKTEATDEQKG